MLTRFFTHERDLAILITILAALLGYFVYAATGILYAPPFYVVIALVANIGGLRVSAFAAALFSFGAYWQWFPERLDLFLVNSSCYFLLAYSVGTLKRKARIMDNMNGNLDILWSIVRTLDYTIVHWPTLSDKSRYLRVTEVKGMASDLTTNVLGWGKIAELREGVEDTTELDGE